jgi:L-serine/L-threonine ammonia-lyase
MQTAESTEDGQKAVRRMYIKTPLIESNHLSTLIGGLPVYLKLENTQPCGSFKLRGISQVIQKACIRN